MPLLVECASCRKKLKLRDELAGKKVKCPCGGVIAVPSAAAPDLVQPAPAPRPARPAPRRPREETLEEVLPADTEPAGVGPASCEFWKCQYGGGVQLLVLEDEGVWSAYPDEKAYKRIKRELEEGDTPENTLGKDGKFFAFRDLTEVNSNLKTRSLGVTCKVGDDESSETWAFKDADQRDDALDAIRRRLGPDFRYQRRDLNRFQAMVSPLLTILALAGLTAFFVFLAWAFEQPRDGGTRVVRTNIWGIIAMYTVGFLGSFWTGVIGGVCILGGVVWMGVRVADPPIEVTIKPKPAGKEDRASRPRKKRRRDDE